MTGLLVAGAACGTGAGLALDGDAKPGGSPDLRCAVVQEGDGSRVALHGTVESDEAGTGRYRLDVRKSGAAGTSNITQAGEFKVQPGVTAGLGQVSLSLEAGAGFDASLTVTVAEKTVTCRASGGAATRL